MLLEYASRPNTHSSLGSDRGQPEDTKEVTTRKAKTQQNTHVPKPILLALPPAASARTRPEPAGPRQNENAGSLFQKAFHVSKGDHRALTRPEAFLSRGPLCLHSSPPLQLPRQVSITSPNTQQPPASCFCFTSAPFGSIPD